MKPIEELRAAHAATTQEGWGAEWKVGAKHQRHVVTAEYAGVQTPVCCFEAFGLPKSNSAFIALAHNEFPAMLDEIEQLRRENEALQNTVDARDDLEADLRMQQQLVELLRGEIEQLRAATGAGRWEITVSEDQQYIYVSHDWASGHGQVQVKAEAEGYIVDLFDDGDNCVASTGALYAELDNED